MELKDPIGIELNNSSEVIGFCPKCLGVDIYQVNTPLNPNSQKLFKGKKYYCWDCRETFNELNERGIK